MKHNFDPCTLDVYLAFDITYSLVPTPMCVYSNLKDVQKPH